MCYIILLTGSVVFRSFDEISFSRSSRWILTVVTSAAHIANSGIDILTRNRSFY